MTAWIEQFGLVLGLIALLAIVIYWHLFDLLQQVFMPRSRFRRWRPWKLKAEQLLVWAGTQPLLGLLGTVNGLFDSFNGLSSGNSLQLTGGISQALLTTQLGLATSLPAVLLLMICQRRCQNRLDLGEAS